MAKVYFKPVTLKKKEEAAAAAKEVLEALEKEAGFEFGRTASPVYLKVHFGEEKNVTYIRPESYKEIITLLKERGGECIYTDTNALYRGDRQKRDTHMELAARHGFSEIPVVIADGRYGEEYEEVRIDKKHFRACKVGKVLAEAEEVIVLSHFKGHILAGFGGAIKQLGMGFASRGGKLAMHATSKPFVNTLSCTACGACKEVCPEGAITIGKKARINKNLCVGCASCTAVCPSNAIKINWLAANLSKIFDEKLAEYAYAAQLGKKIAYVSFALNITKGCDCFGKVMKPIVPDIGILGSWDPVAVDQACLDKVEEVTSKRKFKGRHTLVHAQRIGLGKREYELVTI